MRKSNENTSAQVATEAREIVVRRLEESSVIKERRTPATDEAGVHHTFDDFLIAVVDSHIGLVQQPAVHMLRRLSLDVRYGLRRGYEKYGPNAFYKFNMMRMAREEVRDLFNYTFFEYLKYERRKRTSRTASRRARYNEEQRTLVEIAYQAVRIYMMLCSREGLKPEPEKVK